MYLMCAEEGEENSRSGHFLWMNFERFFSSNACLILVTFESLESAKMAPWPRAVQGSGTYYASNFITGAHATPRTNTAILNKT